MMIGTTRYTDESITSLHSCISFLLFYFRAQKKKWSHGDWCKLYQDVPSRMLKCVVPDRSLIKTTNAEQQVSEPKALQDAIDCLVDKVELGRAFVRPSGTEDIVRIYAEASTQQAADQLAENIKSAVVATLVA